MIVSTTNDIKGYEINKYIGLVNANIVIGANVFSDFFASFTDVLGGNSDSYESILDKIYKQALNQLIEKASHIGANALLGIHFDFDEISGKGKSMFMVTAIGTAVQVGKPKGDNKERFEIYQKLYNLLKFKDSGIITSEQYDIEKNSILLGYETKIQQEIDIVKSENTIKETINKAKLESAKFEQERRKKAEALKAEEEKIEAANKSNAEKIRIAIERFKSNSTAIYNQIKDLMDLNIKSPENDLENLTYDQIMSAQYEDMNIDSSEKMAYTIGRFIKEGKGVAACKYFLEYVDNDDIEYAKTYIYSIYDIITFKKQSTFEIMALNLIELKCLGQTDVAVNEFCKYAVCDIQTAIQAVDLL